MVQQARVQAAQDLPGLNVRQDEQDEQDEQDVEPSTFEAHSVDTSLWRAALNTRR